jgi:hypothetical protein
MFWASANPFDSEPVLELLRLGHQNVSYFVEERRRLKIGMANARTRIQATSYVYVRRRCPVFKSIWFGAAQEPAKASCFTKSQNPWKDGG